jgi:hypothetical protein
MNLYRSNNDWHKDSLNIKPHIKIFDQYILSIGSTRTILFKNIINNNILSFIIVPYFHFLI